MNADVRRTLETAQRAVLCLNTADTNMVRLRTYVFALLEEADTAIRYRYPDLTLAYLRRSERLVESLDRTRLCAPDHLHLAVRALRDARQMVQAAVPDLPAVAEVNLDSVVERLVAEAYRERLLKSVRDDRPAPGWRP